MILRHLRRSVYLLLIYTLPLLAQSAAGADPIVPATVKFAGALNDANGKPLAGTVGVTFLLYKEQSGGAPLWMETQNVQADKSGHYSVLLGSTKGEGMPAEAFAAGQARWLAVQPTGQAEQQRVELVSVPYALKAADAQTLGGLPASAFLLAPVTGSTASPASAGTQTPQPQAVGTKPVTTAGGTAQFVPKFDGIADLTNSQILDTGTNVGIGINAPVAKLDVNGTGNFRGPLTLAITGGTATNGKNSPPLNFTGSAFNSATAQAVNETFRLQLKTVNNNTANPSGKLDFLFASGTAAPAETGLSISNKGLITFAPGQTFPGGTGGSGTVKSVALSAPVSDFSVSGSPVTSSGTLNLQWLIPPTSSNLPNAIVKRDNLGNFSAGTITSNQLSALLVRGGQIQGNSNTDSLLMGGVVGINSAEGNGQGYGVVGISDSRGGAGVVGQNSFGGIGLLGLGGDLFSTSSGQGVWGESFGTELGPNGSGPDGVDGISHSTLGSGVAAVNTTSGDGLFAQSNKGFAAFFLGDVDVDGTLSKASGSFKIDHPLDPANQYLYHSFVESPDMMNIYNGVAELDSEGEAVVKMPDWFEALNKDFRYQLTSMGAPGPNLYIAAEISNNQFKIAGGKPGAKVSWQVTGVRHDAWADAHRIPVEQAKPEKERGLYLHPELFGAPAEKSIAEAKHPGAMKMAKQSEARRGASQKQ